VSPNGQQDQNLRSPCGTAEATGANRGPGIMPYRNECHFLKMVGDDGNAAAAPEIADVDRTSNSDHGSHGWSVPHDTPASTRTTLPTRERGTGRSYIPLHGLMPVGSTLQTYSDMDAGSSNQDLSPDGGQSNRHTPNSSAASDQQRNNNNLAPGRTNGGQRSGLSSFEASPVSSHTNLNMIGTTTQAEQAAAMGVGVGVGMPVVTDASYFSAANAFSMPTGLTPDPRFSMPDTPSGGGAFVMPSSWMETGPNGSEMTPVAEGVLRSIIMGPMETMDLWDTNQ
jgi:hypothetical protein